MNDHFRPVGSPRRRDAQAEAFTISMTCSRGVFSARIFFHDS